MIKRALILGLGAMIGVRIATHLGAAMRKQMHRKMRDHCKQMASQCRQVAADFRERQPTATAS